MPTLPNQTYAPQWWSIQGHVLHPDRVTPLIVSGKDRPHFLRSSHGPHLARQEAQRGGIYSISKAPTGIKKSSQGSMRTEPLSMIQGRRRPTATPGDRTTMVRSLTWRRGGLRGFFPMLPRTAEGLNP